MVSLHTIIQIWIFLGSTNLQHCHGPPQKQSQGPNTHVSQQMTLIEHQLAQPQTQAPHDGLASSFACAWDGSMRQQGQYNWEECMRMRWKVVDQPGNHLVGVQGVDFDQKWSEQLMWNGHILTIGQNQWAWCGHQIELAHFQAWDHGRRSPSCEHTPGPPPPLMHRTWRHHSNTIIKINQINRNNNLGEKRGEKEKKRRRHSILVQGPRVHQGFGLRNRMIAWFQKNCDNEH